MYQVCKIFDFESGHILSKSLDRCRFPHGHSRRVQVVLAAEELDQNDMVCNFRWIKLALAQILDRLDHAMCINASDPRLKDFQKMEAKLELFADQDPTCEILARRIFDELHHKLTSQAQFNGPAETTYSVPCTVRLLRVRLWETPTSWAEYSR